MAPVLKILGVPRLSVPRLPPGGSLGTDKRGTVPKIWCAVPIFLARVFTRVFKSASHEKSIFLKIRSFFFL